MKAGTLLLLLLLVDTARHSKATEKRKVPPLNVLLITIDDLRPWIGSYGDKAAFTPNIDALSSTGLVFNRSYVQQAVCGPSRISFLTGRRPDTTKLYDFDSYWRTHAGNFTTMPEAFKAAGYEAMSFGKIFHPGVASGSKSPSNQGGKTGDDYPYSWTGKPYHAPTEKNKQASVCPPSIPGQRNGTLYMNLVCPVDVDSQPGGRLPDQQITDAALKYLASRKKMQEPEPAAAVINATAFAAPHANNEAELMAAEEGREEGEEKKKQTPMFLAVGYHKPHIPLKFPKKYLDLIPANTVNLASNPTPPAWMLKQPGSVAWQSYDDVRSRNDVTALNVSWPYGPIPDFYAFEVRRGYLSAIAYIDNEVGRLLAGLDSAGLKDNTVVALVGDHGWALGEHGEWAKYQVFEVATRIPTIIRAPPSSLVFATASSGGKQGWGKVEAAVVVEDGVASSSAGAAKGGAVTNALFELVDLWPTLADLAGTTVPPKCPASRDASLATITCVEGASGARLFADPTASFKSAAFSQYPRPELFDTNTSRLPDLDTIKYMGYTIRTEAWRWTEWLPFNHTSFVADFDAPVWQELYSHAEDEDENNNYCTAPGSCGSQQAVATQLAVQLRAGWAAALP